MTVQPVLDEAEILVVGAGPAGSAAATTLAAYGHDVLVIDRNEFPRHKACGDGLTSTCVSVLRRFDMTDLLERSQRIDGTRIVFDHAREEVKGSRDDAGRCVSRFDLDNALLSRARAAGARFRTARAAKPIQTAEGVTAVEVDDHGAMTRIVARHVIAADGPTSRMRQRLGLATPVFNPTSYAVRQYFTVENTLDPYFDIYAPIYAGDVGLVGYGWVFPLGRHDANIGVGSYRGYAIAATPSIREVFRQFIADLGRHHEARFGALTAHGDLYGSPLGVNFARDVCEWRNVYFVGDAARMTDPYTGEGIGNALASGEEAGEYLHGVIRGAASAGRLGERLARVSIRVGQDVAMPARVVSRALNAPDHVELGEKVPHRLSGMPFLESVKFTASTEPIATARTFFPGASEDVALDAAMASFDVRARDYLRATFPFVAESFDRRLHARSGPVRAAVLFMAVRSCGADVGDPAISLALAMELVDVFPELLAETIDQPGSTRDKLNNAFSVITADYLLTRALKLIRTFDPATVRGLAQHACMTCDGAMAEIEGLPGVNSETEIYNAAVTLRSARMCGFAALKGGELGGAPASAARALESYGCHLGLAFRALGDIHDLLNRRTETSGHTTMFHARKRYCLPVVHAIGRDPALRDHLAAPVADTDHDPLIELVAEAGGFEMAAADCGAYAERAKEVLAGLTGLDPRPLYALADVPARRCTDLLVGLPVAERG